MPSHETRILFVGDMHLGTQPARVPASAGDPARFGPAEAWRRTVDAAREHRVHAVALAGDVVNRRNELFEARRDLDQGLARLAEAGIPVLAVAGNHDTATLPPLAAGDRRLELLGGGGTWSGREVGDDPAVRIVGWSFPRERHERSPLDTPPPAAEPGRVTFGLLHGDLDASSSSYAPVSGAELRACDYDGWFLGHIHTPGAVASDGSPFYLGSLTGLDPTETGLHGPLLVKVQGDGSWHARRLDLAPLRWERLFLSCDDLRDPHEDPWSAVQSGLATFVAALGVATGTALGVRVTLTGEVDRPATLAAAVARLVRTDLVTEIDGTTVFVDRVELATHRRADLAALARGTDPVGLLARRVLVLQGEVGDPALLDHLLATARAAVDEVDRLPSCRLLADSIDDATLRATAAGAARRLLDRMLATRGGAA